MRKTIIHIKQWITSVLEFRLMFEKSLEVKLKELDLQLTKAKNRDINHLEDVSRDILGCSENVKDPLLILYITKYSALSVDRVLELGDFIDMKDPLVINVVMNMANKGYNNKTIIQTLNRSFTPV